MNSSEHYASTIQKNWVILSSEERPTGNTVPIPIVSAPTVNNVTDAIVSSSTVNNVADAIVSSPTVNNVADAIVSAPTVNNVTDQCRIQDSEKGGSVPILRCHAEGSA